MTAAELATRVGARRNGGAWSANCPGHEDRRASLSIGEGKDGRVLLRCHAGCDLSAILAKLSLREADLFPAREVRESDGRGRIVSTYDYADEACALLYQVVRFEPKDFRQRRPDGKGGWSWNLGEARRVLFRLARVVAAAKARGVVFLVEGEKDALALEALGLTATTNAGGAGKWRPEYVEAVRGCKGVVVLPDNDEVGRRHAAQVAESIHAAGVPVKVVELAGLPVKGDTSDWLAAGGTREGLIKLVRAAPRWERDAKAAPEPPVLERENQTAAPAASRKTARRLQGTAVEFEAPEPWRESVDGAALLDDIAALVTRYVVLPEHAAEATALWILHTWTLDAAEVTPLLALGSPTKRCGKTTLLRIIAALSRRPLAASGISAAAIYRMVEQHAPTLLIDELDAAREDEDLRAVLNSGHTRDLAFVVRCVGEGAKIEPRRFSTWCPKALAYIGRIAGTLEDRAIRVPMRRRSAGERCERLRRRVLAAHAEPLRRKLARWAEDALSGLAKATPALPDELDDRAADNWEPLFGIADDVGGGWPDRARRAAAALSSERPEDEAAENPGLLVLADLRDLIEAGRLETEPGVAGDDACQALRDLPERSWKTWGRGRDGLQPVHLARLLRPFGCAPKQVRAEGRGGRRRYLIDPVSEAFARYLAPPVPRATPATGSDPLHASPDGSTSVAGVAGVAGLHGCSGSGVDSAAGEDL